MNYNIGDKVRWPAGSVISDVATVIGFYDEKVCISFGSDFAVLTVPEHQLELALLDTMAGI